MAEHIEISIIIPVYNVEKFLKKCIDSVVNQTYRNFEVILIDDGSIDLSGEICDEYAEKYSYIKVFHKKNGGQAAARNYGVTLAKGKYVTFIDSDDFVEKNYLEVLIDIVTENHVDMAVVQHKDEVVEIESEVKENVMQDIDVEIMDDLKAIETLCYEKKISASPVCKLIPIEIVKKHPFPEGKIYEDLDTIYKYFGETKKIGYKGLKLYHYVYHEGSTVHSEWNSKMYYVMEAARHLLEYIDKYYPEIHDAGVQRYFFSANEIYIHAFFEENYLQIVEPIQLELQNFWSCAKKNPQIYMKQKIRYWLMTYHPIIYRRIWVAVKGK